MNRRHARLAKQAVVEARRRAVLLLAYDVLDADALHYGQGLLLSLEQAESAIDELLGERKRQD